MPEPIYGLLIVARDGAHVPALRPVAENILLGLSANHCTLDPTMARLRNRYVCPSSLGAESTTKRLDLLYVTVHRGHPSVVRCVSGPSSSKCLTALSEARYLLNLEQTPPNRVARAAVSARLIASEYFSVGTGDAMTVWLHRP
jgi:hypothetical protein